jgi:hypothetical protein
MIKRKSWQEFRDSGLFWFINSTLHLFGWTICFEFEKDVIIDVFPARTKFRGFSEEQNTSGYRMITKYLKENIEDISKEV